MHIPCDAIFYDYVYECYEPTEYYKDGILV